MVGQIFRGKKTRDVFETKARMGRGGVGIRVTIV